MFSHLEHTAFQNDFMVDIQTLCVNSTDNCDCIKEREGTDSQHAKKTQCLDGSITRLICGRFDLLKPQKYEWTLKRVISTCAAERLKF